MNLIALQGAVELGLIYAVMALGVFISFRTLNMPDLTVDGSFVLGAAVSAILASLGYPVPGLILGFIAGAAAGMITALLHTKLGIQPLLSGILVMLSLYSVNLRVMGNKSNIPLLNKATVFSIFKDTPLADYSGLILGAILLAILLVLLYLLLKTRFGLVLRATGDNEHMVRASGVNTDREKLIGLALANGLVGLSGGMIAQYQRFADTGMGVGMVIIGLASVIIGEVIFGTQTLLRRLIAVVLGAILYRAVIAIALDLGMPATDLKLISAVIVTLALAIPFIGKKYSKLRRRLAVFKEKEEGNDDA